MSQLFNTNNPGIGDTGGVTLEEGLLLSDLASLSYATGDILYYDGSQLQRLPIGTNNQYLKVATDIPAWATVAGGGDVSKVGTPVNNQVGVWTGDGTIEGDASLTFDTTTDALTVAGVVITPVIRASSSAGLLVEANGGTDVADFGAGGGSNATFYGGVTVNGQLRSNTALLLEETGAGTDAITIQAPASIGASFTLTLPDTDGNANEYLKTDGSGVLSWGTPSGTGGISRTIVVTSGSVTAGSASSTDYAYFVAGAHTISMPAASGNTNRYTIKNNHSAAITIDTVGAENIDGTASIQIAPEDSVDLISDGTNWFVV